jgi:hypothetical protein
MKQSPAAAEWADRAGLVSQSRVEHTRHIPGAELSDWLRAADALVGITVTPVTSADITTTYFPSEGQPSVAYKRAVEGMPMGHVGVKVTATPDAYNSGTPGHLTDYWRLVDLRKLSPSQ